MNNKNRANMPKGRGVVKRTPFASMPEQFTGIREMIKENAKLPRLIVTQMHKSELKIDCSFRH